MTNSNNYKKLNKLKKYDSICLIGHKDPDPDALSSMVVLKEFLTNEFEIENISLFAEVNELSPQCLEILDGIELNPNLISFDCAILLDSPNIDRAGIYSFLLKNAECTVVIDHHNTNELDFDINIVEETSSTCEIVYSILNYFGYTPSDESKGKLYAGVITDTGNFTVGKIGPRTFELASDYVNDIDYVNIYKAFLMNNTLKNIKVLGLTIQNLTSHHDDKLILTHISQEEATKMDLSSDDYLGIVNYLNTIKEANIVCFIQPKGNEFYVSMRAKEGFNVADVAKRHNGGGHIGAAAFQTDQPIKEIKEYLVKEFAEQLSTNQRKRKKIFYR